MFDSKFRNISFHKSEERRFGGSSVFDLEKPATRRGGMAKTRERFLGDHNIHAKLRFSNNLYEVMKNEKEVISVLIDGICVRGGGDIDERLRCELGEVHFGASGRRKES